MQLNEIEYPLRLCVEMLHYCCWSCGATKDLTASEIKARLADYFGEEMVNQAVDIVTGK